MFPSSTKRELITQAFSRRSRATTAKKCTKKHDIDTRAKLLFCQSKPIGLLPFSLQSPSSFLKLPCDDDGRGRANTGRCATSRNVFEEAYFLPLTRKSATQPFFCVVKQRSRCLTTQRTAMQHTMNKKEGLIYGTVTMARKTA